MTGRHGRQPGGRLFAAHLPPYTPELGSIEIQWRTVRSAIANTARHHKRLEGGRVKALLNSGRLIVPIAPYERDRLSGARRCTARAGNAVSRSPPDFYRRMRLNGPDVTKEAGRPVCCCLGRVSQIAAKIAAYSAVADKIRPRMLSFSNSLATIVRTPTRASATRTAVIYRRAPLRIRDMADR